ncbi:MarR family transcriptional regulator [Streptomyces sp. HPF1205]|uniref:MarR family transcriptional regulator n=1 Tax=Streptomyces sp. HPF1205 TaxID=2873262 RepID=UPI001CEC761D|nr:MarR family transcriptional regulator [Streptomyces sp. HPF1205]
MDDIAHSTEAADAVLSPALTAYTGHLLRRAYIRANRLAEAGAEPPAGGAGGVRDFEVLDALREPAAASYSQQDLGELLGINRTTMVKLIDRLESAGLVRRSRNPGDRRSYVLALTAVGRDALRAMEPAMGVRDRRLTDALTPAERDRLDGLLAGLLAGPRPPEDPDRHRTGSLITRSHHLVRRRVEVALTAAGLQAARHFGALTVLDDGPCSQQQLARRLGVSEQAVLQIVDDLDDAGLVARDRDPLDRRRYALRLTPAGQEARRRSRDVVEATEADLGRTLGTEGRAELRALLIKLLRTEA